MTILCATTAGLPGIRPCTVRGSHKVSCPNYENWETTPGACTGCLPRAAEKGYLCYSCWERLDAAYIKWGPFRRLVIETEGRAVSPDNGGVKGSSPIGFTNLTLATITLDECERLLESMTGLTLDAWVHTEQGATDGIMFAHAAERAYRSLEVEKKPLRLERVRCPHCGLLSLGENPTRKRHGVTIVECQHCGTELTKVRDETPTWLGSAECEQGEHSVCPVFNCRCDCHIEREVAA